MPGLGKAGWAPHAIAVSNHVLDGIEGKLTNAKSAEIDQCSAGIALRDLTDLLA